MLIQSQERQQYAHDPKPTTVGCPPESFTEDGATTRNACNSHCQLLLHRTGFSASTLRESLQYHWASTFLGRDASKRQERTTTRAQRSLQYLWRLLLLPHRVGFATHISANRQQGQCGNGHNVLPQLALHIASHPQPGVRTWRFSNPSSHQHPLACRPTSFTPPSLP